LRQRIPCLAFIILVVGLGLFWRGTIIAYINPPPAVNVNPALLPVVVSQGQSDPSLTPARHDVIATVPRPATEQYSGTVIPILMYHEVTSGPNSLYVPADRFREQIQYLAQSGYRTVTMAQAREMLQNNKIPAKTVVLTFDDGYESVLTKAWPIMQEYGFTGTTYVCATFIGRSNYLTLDQIKQLQAEGMEIGSHTNNHISLKEASYQLQVDEIAGSKRTLEEHLGAPCLSFCYPTGTYSDITPTLIKDAGYTSAVTVAYGHASPVSNPFLTPRVRVPGWITLDKFAQNIPK